MITIQYDTIQYGIFTGAQKLTIRPASKTCIKNEKIRKN